MEEEEEVEVVKAERKGDEEEEEEEEVGEGKMDKGGRWGSRKSTGDKKVEQEGGGG